MKQIITITRKELTAYFGTPAALIFLAIFLLITCFSFFWVSGFYARSLADIRPLFRWMPLLLIFLVAALTMRQWSEEQRTGTLETLMTLPITRWQSVLGKFLSVMVLVVLALLLTLPIPAVVAVLGPLDWGPVIGGYLACLLLAAAYTALGLWMSALTDNQIVALLLTGVVGGLLYLAGSPVVLALAGEPWISFLRAVGTSSRFASIERGVLDLRDLVYYGSLTAFFLFSTGFTLDRKRWSHGAGMAGYRRAAGLTAVLVGSNLLALNLWLAPLWNLRFDATAQQEYTLSQTTKDLLGNLQEPLLIRAYVSEKSHPLLDPLRPQVEDFLREYAIAGQGKVQAEVVDPAQNPDLEAEANQTYGIRPTPFQVADRYQASLINAYFDILVRYGDQDVVLNFRDLIQVDQNQDGGVDVRLRNLEYDLTSAVKKALYGFQSIDTVLAAQEQPVTLTLYTTPQTLPPDLAAAPATIKTVAEELAQKSNGKLRFVQADPSDPNSGVTAQQLFDRYGIQSVPTDLFSPESFYLHMVVTNGDAAQVIYPQNDLGEAAVRDAIQNAVLRTASGYLKTIGLWVPPSTPTPDALGQMQAPLQSYNLLRDQLSQEYTVRDVDLSTGQPPVNVDMLLLVAPQNLTDQARFAIDQYLMRGGAVVVLAGNYAISQDPFSGQLALQPLDGTLRELLQHYGVDVQTALVLDTQNQPFPSPTVRDAGGIQVQEIQALNYPFFVDVRANGMNSKAGVTGNLPNVTMYWTSPVVVDQSIIATYSVVSLLQSSANAWLRSDPNIQADYITYPQSGFPVEGEASVQPLAVALQGPFTSFFAGKPNPLAAPDATGAMSGTTPIVAQLDQAPENARLIVAGSSEMADDAVLQLSASLVGQQVLNNLQFVHNAVDWSVEDTDLLGLRTRGAYTRLLEPLTETNQQFWELMTYVLIVAGLGLVAVAAYVWRRNEKPMELAPAREFKDVSNGFDTGPIA